MSGPDDLYSNLTALAAQAARRLEGVDDKLKDELSDELEAVKMVARVASHPPAPSPVERAAAIREAAHTVNGLDYGPFNAIVAKWDEKP